MRVCSKESRTSVKTGKRSKVSETNTTQHNPAKRSRNRVPAPQRERILQQHIAGKSIVAISRDENRNRETVARIVHSDEMQAYVARMRERFFGVGELALSTLCYALREKSDGQLAYRVLADIGVVPSPAERLQIQLTQQSPGEDARVLAIMARLTGFGIAKCRADGIDTSDDEKKLADAGGRVDEKGNIVPIE